MYCPIFPTSTQNYLAMPHPSDKVRTMSFGPNHIHFKPHTKKCLEEGDHQISQAHPDDASTENDYSIKEKDEHVKTQKYKTEICHNWAIHGECKFGNKCSFAHGEHELQLRTDLPTNYKTKECKNFKEQGFCKYGSRCQFIHKCEIIKRVDYQNLLQKNLTHMETIAQKNINFDWMYVNIGEPRALKIFEALREPTHCI